MSGTDRRSLSHVLAHGLPFPTSPYPQTTALEYVPMKSRKNLLGCESAAYQHSTIWGKSFTHLLYSTERLEQVSERGGLLTALAQLPDGTVSS